MMRVFIYKPRSGSYKPVSYKAATKIAMKIYVTRKEIPNEKMKIKYFVMYNIFKINGVVQI